MSAKFGGSKGGKSGIPTLEELCQDRILRILEKNKFHPRYARVPALYISIYRDGAVLLYFVTSF